MLDRSMFGRHSIRLDDGRMAHVVTSTRAVGDLGERAGADERRRALVDHPWTVLHQVHGGSVVTVDVPGAQSGVDADAAVTTCSAAAIAVLTADCAPVTIVSESGGLAVVHAGWRGLLADVVGNASAALQELVPGRCHAVIGPHISPECYEFSPSDIEPLVDRFGPTVRSTSGSGAPALDLGAAVSVALAECGIEVVVDLSGCTACGGSWYSHRARGDVERQAMVAWIED